MQGIASVHKYHLIGTCTIDGVVDDRWKVQGVKASRVINASVFVEDVSGDITRSTYAAAEGGGADLMKKDDGRFVGLRELILSYTSRGASDTVVFLPTQ